LKENNQTSNTIEAKILTKEVARTQTHETPLEQTIEVWNSKGNG
jgi:hypothetical protein